MTVDDARIARDVSVNARVAVCVAEVNQFVAAVGNRKRARARLDDEIIIGDFQARHVACHLNFVAGEEIGNEAVAAVVGVAAQVLVEDFRRGFG